MGRLGGWVRDRGTSVADVDGVEPLAECYESLSDGVVTASFWLAVLLPAVYLPLLLARPATLETLGMVVALLALHVVSLRVGHAHDPDGD